MFYYDFAKSFWIDPINTLKDLFNNIYSLSRNPFLCLFLIPFYPIFGESRDSFIFLIEIICIIIQLVRIVFIGDFDNEGFKLSTSIIVPIITQVGLVINTIIRFIINKDLAKVQFVCISVMVLINFVFLFL